MNRKNYQNCIQYIWALCLVAKNEFCIFSFFLKEQKKWFNNIAIIFRCLKCVSLRKDYTNIGQNGHFPFFSLLVAESRAQAWYRKTYHSFWKKRCALVCVWFSNTLPKPYSVRLMRICILFTWDNSLRVSTAVC